MILGICGFLWEGVEEGVWEWGEGAGGAGNSVWREGGRVEKDSAVLDAEESGSERR